MAPKRELTQAQIDWLLSHPQLTALVDRLLKEFGEAENTFERSPTD